jgi:PLP dependent protein
MAETIAERLFVVRQGIERAADKAGRDPAGIRLVAVSKTKPAADVRKAMAAGQLDFGENYGQELRDKLAGVSDPRVRWHFIGKLQTNKVKDVVGRVALIHSADSAKLILEIAKRAAGMKAVQEILIEVKLGGEESKSGAAEAEVGGLIEVALKEPAVRLRGLMTMPPYFPEAEKSRPFYRRLRELRDREQARLGSRVNLADLSMGLSHDYQVAIAEGATLVRVGTAIFGAR